MKLYNKGTHRLEKEMGFENITKQLRQLRIYMKLKGMDGSQKFDVQNHHKNIIDLEKNEKEEKKQDSGIVSAIPSQEFMANRFKDALKGMKKENEKEMKKENEKENASKNRISKE